MPKKQVKGLLDYMALKPDEEWDFAPNSEEYVHGMGMGASKDAIRWAYMGYMLEMRQGMIKFKKMLVEKNSTSRKCTLPKSHANMAFCEQKRNELESLKNRHLILEMQKLGEHDQTINKLFPK